jgi:hypothetical protein
MCLRKQRSAAVEALTFQTKDIAASGGLPHQGTCLLSKGFWLDGFLGVEPRNVGASAICVCVWGGEHFG